jgi:hypothetical protein
MPKKRLVAGVALFFFILSTGVFPAFGAGPLPQSIFGGSTDLATGQSCTDTPAYNDYARFVAGLRSTQGPLAAKEANSAWINFARVMDQSWARFKQRQLEVMEAWASQELSQAQCPTVFYPFSGPDFVNMFTLFPQAKTYLMVSLEPAGEIPDFSTPQARNSFFPGLQRSLYDLLQLSFFITPKLRASLGKHDIKGVLSVLLFFMAREGVQVEDVQYWVMKPEGVMEETSATTAPIACSPGDIPGLKITFTRPAAGEPQTLYYFRFNLGNDSMQQNQQFLSFLEKFGPLTTFSKAASYLMHKPYFSAIRQFILAKSTSVLQSDSAIPVSYFDPSAWNLQFYGCYKGPIALFQNRYQPELAEIYQTSQDIRPLPFGICYRHRPRTSNLMLAVKKAKLAHNDTD